MPVYFVFLLLPQARAGMLEEQQQVNENDLVEAAASTMAALGGGVDPSGSSGVGASGNESTSSPSAPPLTNLTSSGSTSAAIPASALLLGGLTNADEEDNYD